MKQKKFAQLAASALISVWIAGSLSVTALRSLGIEASAWQALAACLAAALFGVLASVNRVTAALAGLAAAAGGVWLAAERAEALQAFIAALPENLAGGFMAQPETLLPVVVILGVVWTLFVFASTHTQSGGFLSMVFVLLYWLLLRSVAGAPEIPLMLITLVGVAALFAVPVGGVSQYIKALLPTALIAAVLAVALLPAEGTTCKPLEDMADKVRSVFNSYFSFTDTRVPYSISMDGYHPLGETLGGPAEPNRWPVMDVETEHDLYLRGTIRRTYVNTAWTDAVAGNRYLYGDPSKSGVRSGVFESGRVDAEASAGAFRTVQARIELLSEGTSTLFVPHRLTDLRAAIDIVPYYNTVGDVFITRDVQPGDSYRVEAVVPSADKEALRAYIEAHREDDDPGYAEAAAGFMQLPDYIESGVYEIVRDVTAGARTDYQKAAAIERYLEANYAYTLDVDMPRSDRDFVSEFLLGSKEGYCSYFASAMAVMGRIAGLPTRYVEGYRVQAMPLGLTTVTGENAHAWVEVYMNGVGWVTFDPTPGDGISNAGDEANSDDEAASGDETATAEPTLPPQEDGEGELSDLPTLPPEGEPTAEPLEGTENPSAEPTVTPEPPPEEDRPDEPTPPPEMPEEPPTEDSPKESGSRMKWLLAALIALGILIVLAVLAALRLKMSDPAVVAVRYHGDAMMQLMVYYRAMLTLLEMQGQVPESGESPMAFGRRLARTGVADKGFMEFTGRLAYGQYAGKGANTNDVALAGKVYSAMVKQLRTGEKLRWRWTRIRRGMGSVEQIP